MIPETSSRRGDEPTMKLYMHPMSTTCRPIMLFAAEEGIALEQQVVDILAGEQFKPEFLAINPNGLVPALEDGNFRLTESSAILKYMADKSGSSAYPKDLQARARVNEVMDWFNTNFYRSFGYGLCYSQLLDFYKLPDETGQRLSLEAAKQRAARNLGILNDHMLGEQQTFLCGDRITIADYFASGLLSLGEVTGCTFAAYPNVLRWYGRMKGLPQWQATNAGVFAWADFARGPAYVNL
jgi:glutathione S-transferase